MARTRITDQLKRNLKDFKINNQLINHNYINAAQKARKWIKRNTIQNNGIVITSKQRTIYQEVTGYYIPTLLLWGMRDEAVAWTKYLCDVQQPSGAWLNFKGTKESVFNSGQVLRGLVAVSDIYSNAKEHLIKGCDWLISNVNKEGRLVSVPGTEWPTNGMNSELIHLYCLPPLKEAGIKYQRDDYLQAVDKVLTYYKKNYLEDIENFNYLSHFYAYVLESLLDLGETELVKTSMLKIDQLQTINGAVPAYKNCHWVCSTGLFQLAIVWFKLGEWHKGNRIFDYAVSLQNKSGGWYGGYPARLRLVNGINIYYAFNEKITYFPNEEISWAVKYFLDALYYREKLEFEAKAHTFLNHIESYDGKFKAIYNELMKSESYAEGHLKIADIGCGKGRYLNKLLLKNPDNEYYGIDLSTTVLTYIRNEKIKKQTGSILNIKFQNDFFDIVYAAESLEHAIFIDLALKEMVRVTKPGGKIIIIDKERSSFEKVKYLSWIDPKELSTKQWLDTNEMKDIFTQLGLIDIDIFYIPSDEGNMYKAYIGRKRNE